MTLLRLSNVRVVRSSSDGEVSLDASLQDNSTLEELGGFVLGPSGDDVWVRTCEEEGDGTFVDGERLFWASKSEDDFYFGKDADDARKNADERTLQRIIDCNNLIAAPGFIDVQINGAFGVDFTSDDVTAENVDEVARGILAHGVTAFCPTIVTSPPEQYRSILPKIRRRKGCARQGAAVLGVHLEGPFMAMEKKGAHRPEYIRSTCDLSVYGDDLNDLRDVNIITLAPELDGATDMIRQVSNRGIVASMGHTMAHYEHAEKAMGAGASCITHLFNAMGTFHHRDPGLTGLVGTPSFRSRLHYGIIADGLHSHPASVSIAYQSHPQGCVLVTDAMCAMGLGVGSHQLGTMNVEVKRGTMSGRHGIMAVLSGTETLAGSVASMDECVRNFNAFTKCGVAAACEAASLSPARLLGIDNTKGRIRNGYDADLVLMDDDLNVQATFVGGACVWCADSAPSQVRELLAPRLTVIADEK